MGSVNKVLLLGNLGKDPDTRILSNGDHMANLVLATTESWTDKDGNRRKTEWHRIVLFRKLAEVAAKYLKKGAKIYVEGKLETRKWTDKEGFERYTTEVNASVLKMIGRGKDATEPSNEVSADTSDDIPF